MKLATMPISRLILCTSIAALGVFSLSAGHSSAAALAYGTMDTTITQNFDSLSSVNGPGPTLTGAGPFDFDSAPLSTAAMTGWQLAKVGGSGLNAIYIVDSGASTTGGVHDYGIASANGVVTDRALGSLTSGSVTSAFGLVLTNTTGSTLNQITLGFDGEQWRYGGSSGFLDKLLFSYSVGATSVSTGTFTSFSGLDFSSLVTSGTSGALDGNAAANRTAGMTATLNGLGWASGSTLVLRWTEIDITGSDNGLAIDNFSFVAHTGAVVHNLTWNVGSGTWDTSTANWTGDATIFTTGDNTTFSNAAGGTVTIQAGGVAPHNVVVSAPSGTYTFQNTGSDTNGIAGGASTSLSKSGGGTLVLASQNTFTGGTTVTGGTLQVSADNQLGGASGALVLDGGSTLATTAPVTTARALTVGSGGAVLATSGNTFTDNTAAALSGVLTVSGAGTVKFNALVNFGTTGALSIGTGSSVTLAAPSGSMTMNAGGVFNGDLIVNTTSLVRLNGTATTYGGLGQIKVLGSAMGAGSGGTQISGGAFPAFNALLTTFQTPTVTSEIVLNPAGTGHVAWSPGDVTTPTYKTASFLAFIGPGSGTGVMTLNKKITGEGDLFISSSSTVGGGGGTMVLNAVNDYLGNTLINTSSTIQIGVNNALPVATHVVFNSLTGGTTPALAATLDLHGFNLQVASLSNEAHGIPSALSIVNLSPDADSVLTVSGTVTPVNGFAGSILGDGPGRLLALVKAGTNKLSLSGVNTYAGGTTISGGILNVNSDDALGSIIGGVTISGGATLQADADFTSSRVITLGVGGGTLDSNGHSVTLTGSSSISGTTLTKVGTGALTLGGTQSYATLNANGGITNVNSAVGSGTSTINANVTTNIRASQNLASLSIAGGVQVTFGDGPALASESEKLEGVVLVPEPASLGLLLAGAFGFIGRRRR